MSQSLSRQRGFSLTEMAVALSVAGLLTGGVLKGVELMEQARLLKSGALLEATSTGHQLFLDKYQYMPGDLPGATQLIAASLVNGNGDNILTVTGDDKDNDGWTGEAYNYWAHLSAAGLGPGARGETAADMATAAAAAGLQSMVDGSQYPMFPLGGYMQVISGATARKIPETGGVPRTITSIATGTASAWPQMQLNEVYYRIGTSPASQTATTAGVLSFAASNNALTAVNQIDLYRMDLKFDDGKPSSGRLMTTSADCIGADTSANQYMPGTIGVGVSTSCLALYRAASTGGSPNIVD
ncbi:type II secretion system protein [Polaromonas sp.]|uniref:type II secretion system protein n=1 Tax=Polaromonas sp. TaxID=1869339 RepID=UPI003569D889